MLDGQTFVREDDAHDPLYFLGTIDRIPEQPTNEVNRVRDRALERKLAAEPHHERRSNPWNQAERAAHDELGRGTLLFDRERTHGVACAAKRRPEAIVGRGRSSPAQRIELQIRVRDVEQQRDDARRLRASRPDLGEALPAQRDALGLLPCAP